MKYALQNRISKKIYLITKEQEQFVRKMFEEKVMIQADWSITEYTEMDTCVPYQE